MIANKPRRQHWRHSRDNKVVVGNVEPRLSKRLAKFCFLTLLPSLLFPPCFFRLQKTHAAQTNLKLLSAHEIEYNSPNRTVTAAQRLL